MPKRSVAVFLFILLAVASDALANKPSVTLAAPQTVAAGTEVTIKINVSHRGNSGAHHTNWVWVKADGVEIGRWEFSRSKLPESEDFSREVKFTVNKPVDITAQGHCNIHGSKDPVSMKIDVK